MFSVSYFFTQYCTYVYVYIYANTYLTKRVRCGPVLSVAVRRLTQRLSREYEIQYVRLQKIQTYPTAIHTCICLFGVLHLYINPFICTTTHPKL